MYFLECLVQLQCGTNNGLCLVFLPDHIVVNSVLEVKHTTGTHSLLSLVSAISFFLNLLSAISFLFFLFSVYLDDN